MARHPNPHYTYAGKTAAQPYMHDGPSCEVLPEHTDTGHANQLVDAGVDIEKSFVKSK